MCSTRGAVSNGTTKTDASTLGMSLFQTFIREYVLISFQTSFTQMLRWYTEISDMYFLLYRFQFIHSLEVRSVVRIKRELYRYSGVTTQNTYGNMHIYNVHCHSVFLFIVVSS